MFSYMITSREPRLNLLKQPPKTFGLRRKIGKNDKGEPIADSVKAPTPLHMPSLQFQRCPHSIQRQCRSWYRQIFSSLSFYETLLRKIYWLVLCPPFQLQCIELYSKGPGCPWLEHTLTPFPTCSPHLLELAAYQSNEACLGHPLPTARLNPPTHHGFGWAWFWVIFNMGGPGGYVAASIFWVNVGWIIHVHGWFVIWATSEDATADAST